MSGTTAKSIAGCALLVSGVSLKIFGGAIADRLEAKRSADCGPSG